MGFATHLGPWLLGTVKNTTGTTAGTIKNTGCTVVAQSKAVAFGDSAASLAAALPAGATGEAVGANKDASGKYSGGKLNYAMGQFVFMLDQQSSKSPFAASGSSFDRSATKVGVAYKYNATSLVSLQTWNKKRTDGTGAAYSSTTGDASVLLEL